MSRPPPGHTQPPMNGYRLLSLQVKRPGREVGHLPPCSSNGWSFASIPTVSLHGAERDNFNFYPFGCSQVQS